MPSVNHEFDVRVCSAAAWAYVRNIGNWAPLFPGYQRHLEIDDDNFIWQIRGESGVWSRLVEFEVHVQHWNEPSEVLFRIQGRTEPVKGTGRFHLEPTASSSTKLQVDLTVEGHGPTAPLMNTLLKKFFDDQSTPFFDRLVRSMSGSATIQGELMSTAEGSPKGKAPVTAEEGLAESVSLHPRDSAPAQEEFPVGPGLIVVRYDAPRTKEFEEWLHGPHYDDLLSQPKVTAISRFEQIGTTGSRGSYLALIFSSNLVETMSYRTTTGLAAQEEANTRGLIRGETYLARVVYDKRRPLLSKILSRLGKGAR